jgi:hypothetical protein
MITQEDLDRLNSRGRTSAIYQRTLRRLHAAWLAGIIPLANCIQEIIQEGDPEVILIMAGILNVGMAQVDQRAQQIMARMEERIFSPYDLGDPRGDN